MRHTIINYLITIAVFAVGPLYWQLRIIAPVRTPQEVSSQWNQDLYTIYYPIHHFAYSSERLLPAWNPHQLAGTPFLANYNGGPFYPPNFLSAVMPAHKAIGYASALHFGLAGALVFVCARALGLAAPAAAAGALGFMLSGFFTVEGFRPSYLNALALIPAVFLSAGRLVHKPTPWNGVLLGGVLALQFLTGAAQLVCYCAYVLALLAPIGLVAAVHRGEVHHPARRIAGALLLAGITAGLLSAIQLAPTLEVVARAVRSFEGLTLAQTYPGQPSVARLRDVVSSAGLIVPLAVFGLASGFSAITSACLLVVVFTGLVGLGTPVYTRFFYHLPGVNLFRLPHEMLNVGTFAIAILAGLGLDRALRAREDWSTVRRLVTVGVALVVAVLALPEKLPRALACMAGVAAILFSRSRRLRLACAWAVAALVAGDRFLDRGNAVMMPQNNDAAFFAPPPFVEFLRARAVGSRVMIVKDWRRRFPIMEKLGTLYGLDVVQDFEPLAPAAYHEFLRPFESVNADQPLFWGRFYPWPRSSNWALLDMLAVRYVVVPPGVPWPGATADRFRLVYSGTDALILENTRSLPRARLVGRVRVVPDAAAALAAVHSPDFDPRTTAVVHEVLPVTEPPSADDVVRFERLDAEQVVVHVHTQQSALLVLADLYWPGWHATVDGAERPIHRTDYLFRGVVVEPGDHTVRFVYRPWSLRLGAIITTMTLGVLVGAAVWRRAVTHAAHAR